MFTNKKFFFLKLSAVLLIVLLSLGSGSSNGCVMDDKEYYKIVVVATGDSAVSSSAAPLTGYYFIDEDLYFIDPNNIIDEYGDGTYYSYRRSLGNFTDFSFDVTGADYISKITVRLYRDGDVISKQTSTRSTNSSGVTSLAGVSIEYSVSGSN